MRKYLPTIFDQRSDFLPGKKEKLLIKLNQSREKNSEKN